MFLKNLGLLTAFILMVGCASLNSDNGKTPISKQGGDASVLLPELDKSAKNVAVSPMSSAMLFSLLGGEIAGQRGEMHLASAFYTDASKRSGDPQVALRAAQIALFTNNTSAAKSAIELLLQKGVTTPLVQRLALAVYLRLSDLVNSQKYTANLLNENSVPVRSTTLNVGQIILKNSAPEIAEEMVDYLLSKSQHEAAAYLVQSQFKLNQGDLIGATQAARNVVKQDKHWSMGFVQLAKVYEAQGDVKQALLVLKEAQEELDDVILLKAYGQLLARDAQYGLAEESLKQVLKERLADAEATYALGLVQLKQNDSLSASRQFQKLVSHAAYHSKAVFYLGRIAYQKKHYSHALKWYAQVALGSEYIPAQKTMAMIEGAMGNVEAARRRLKDLRERYSAEEKQLYLLEAEILLDEQQYEQVYALMTEALNKDGEAVTIRYTRSIALTELSRTSEAEKDLLLVLDADPVSANTLNALGYLLASKTFRFKEARQYLTKALSLKPSEPAILDSMGWLDYREGRYEKALDLLQRAHAASPEGEIAAHLGEVLWVLGRQAEAKEIWTAAAMRDPGNKHLLEALKKLK